MHVRELGGRLLQQFAKMQQIGQPPLAALRRQQVFSDMALLHQFAQHRQHAALLPALTIGGEFIYQRVPAIFILAHGVDGGGVQTKNTGRQRAAQRALQFRRQHRLQQPEQFARLRRSKYAVAVGAINRRDIKRVERLAYYCRLVAAAHQHGDIGGAHRAHIALFAHPRLSTQSGL